MKGAKIKYESKWRSSSPLQLLYAPILTVHTYLYYIFDRLQHHEHGIIGYMNLGIEVVYWPHKLYEATNKTDKSSYSILNPSKLSNLIFPLI